MNHNLFLEISQGQIIAIATVLEVPLHKKKIIDAFDLTDEALNLLIHRAKELNSLVQLTNSYQFIMPEEKIARQNISLSMFLRPLYFLWEEKPVTDADFSNFRDRVTKIFSFTYNETLLFFNELGTYSEKRLNTNLAIDIYKYTIRLSRNADLSYRKKFLVRSVLNISKLEFMRGLSPINTLKHQQEALKMVHQSNLSAEDALLMLYAGMSEHFCGSRQEGYSLREKGLNYLKQFEYADMESEVVPLVGWHYYLLGNFNITIAYYESMILAIENRKDADIISFAYPPIIFSYMFLGEYHRALILSEIILKNALEVKDRCAVTIILANIGRTYVYMNDLEHAETVLYQAYAAALQEDYGWGLYYTLLGICYLQFKKQNYFACREALSLALKAAHEHGFRTICASPFVLDVLKMIQDRGMDPIEDFDYKALMENFIASENVHMAGASYRHLALIKEAEGNGPKTVLQDLHTSIQLLEKSGSINQLAKTYLECARIFNIINAREKVKKFAQLAWMTFPDMEKKGFPRYLISFVDINDYPVDLSILLEAVWLELRHIINPERLIARLLTSICRHLKTESAAFVQICGGKYHPLLLQNVERGKDSPQYQRMIAIAAHVEENRELFTIQNKDLVLRQQVIEFNINPRFILCVPFLNKDKVRAFLYLESYYKEDALNSADQNLLMSFAQILSEHLFTILDHESFQEIGGEVVNWPEAPEKFRGGKAYCSSIDEKILLIQAQINKIAGTNIPVLIGGETGVGKELFCESIYEQSQCKGAFVKVNCGAIPETLIESELFGYERGSFTGAVKQKKGYFEMADGGTIFLDEIGELSLQTQVKLLRVLQEHELIRVGGTKPVKVDFRLIAATNKNLKEEVEKENFRRDLFYRLNVIQLFIPPLRERKVDIANMANFFVDKFTKELGRPPCRIHSEALVALLEYDWPGNIRELENTMQRAVLLSEENIITRSQIFHEEENPPEAAEVLVPLAEMERKYILKVIRACKGKIAGPKGAAKILGLKRTTLISKMEKLGITNKSYKNF